MDALTELERIDIIRKRTGVGYAEARALLARAGGDVVEALIIHEAEEAQRSPQSRLAGALERLVREGNATRLRVRKGEHTYLEVPVTAGVIGAALAPRLVLAAGVACLVGGCAVEVGRADEKAAQAWQTAGGNGQMQAD